MLPLLRLVARLPLPITHALGALLGLLSLAQPRLRHDIADNLRQAGLYRPARLLRVAMELGKSLVELPAIWLRPLAEVTGWIREVHGWEHVEAARQAGRGLIVLGPHLGCLELAGLYLAERLPITALYRRPRQAWFHELMQAGRNRGQARMVEPNLAGVRALLGALKHNEAVWVLPDQKASKGEGVWAPMFGRWAYLPTLLYRLHGKSGAPAVIFCCERLPRGRGYKLSIEPLPELPDDLDTAVRLVNGTLEAMVARLPEQYLWNYRLHRRLVFETPPEGPAL
jgi:KDO2-lipid IV(A) lauroyltransferase